MLINALLAHTGNKPVWANMLILFFFIMTKDQYQQKINDALSLFTNTESIRELHYIADKLTNQIYKVHDKILSHNERLYYQLLIRGVLSTSAVSTIMLRILKLVTYSKFQKHDSDLTSIVQDIKSLLELALSDLDTLESNHA